MKRVNVPLMLVTLIASAAHAENNYCPSSPPTPFTQQLAQIAVSRAAGRQRYSRHAAGLHL